MSNSFTNQTLAQLELATIGDRYEKKVYVLPKHLDEKVARLHLDQIGARLTKLTKRQAAYIGVVAGRAVQAGPLPVLTATSQRGWITATRAGESFSPVLWRPAGARTGWWRATRVELNPPRHRAALGRILENFR